MTMGVIFVLCSAIISSVHPSMSRSVFIYSAIAYALLLPCSPSLGSQYDICRNQACGNTSVPFPFSVGNNSCGMPGFQIDCADELSPVLSIGGKTYTVLQFSIPDRIFNITSDNDLGMCQSSDDLDLSSSSSIFSLIETYSMTIDVLKCDGKCVPNSFYISGIPEACSMQQLTVREASMQLKISEGLIQNCTDCQNRNGSCGYDISNSKLVCYFQGKSSKLGVILGASLGGVALLIAAGFVICKISPRRRMRNNPSASILVTNKVRYSENRDIEAGVQEKIGGLPIFSYEILKEATNNFAEDKMLGDGGFGSVYLGKLPDGRVVAIKRLYQDNRRRVDQFINEVQILSCLHHPNLVRLYGCTSPESKDLLLVYEYVQNGTVADHLHGEKKAKGLNWDTRLRICMETAQALAFLHDQEPLVLHRDVKTTNILVDEFFKVKVADFELSRFMPPDVTHVSTAPQGTPGYLDPEYYEYFQLTEKSDVYSFGVVLVELISSKLPVDVNRSRNEISLANMALGKIREGNLKEIVDSSLGFDIDDEVRESVTAVAELAFRCLQASKDDRPGMREIVAQLEQMEQKKIHLGEKNFPHIAPPSPTSVQDKWPSTETTPNNSA